MSILTNAANVGTRFLGRGLLITKKYSPEILTAAGIVGGVVTVVLTAKATLKIEPVVDELRNGLDTLDKLKERQPELENNIYNRRDVAKAYLQFGGKISRIYAPAAAMGMASVACILGAHGIMRRRNLALVVAYEALERSFAAYRARVVEEFGEDKDFLYRHGGREEMIIDENGKSKSVVSLDPSGLSVYARFFDETSTQWDKIPEYNLVFLKCQQNYANDMLHARGHIFLNEVYDLLGLERSSAGTFVGWFMDKDGDNFVDFGIYDFSNAQGRAFVNGNERSILLDFNVDGPIYDKIGRKS